MDDDLIRRALRSADESEPSRALLERAVADGAGRRRRRMSLVTIGAVLVVVGAGAVALIRDGAEEIVGVSPTSIATVPPTIPPTVPPAPPPATTVPATTVPLTVPGPTVPVTTAPPTVPFVTSSPSVAPPPSIAPSPCDDVPELTVDRVVTTVLGPSPSRAEGFLQQGFVDASPSDVQLWGPDGLVATIGDTVPDNPEQWYCPTSLVPMAYDGTFAWFTTGGREACGSCGPRHPAVVFRVDATTGDAVVAWSSDDAARVYDVDPHGDGSAVVLWGPFDGAGALVAFDTSGTGSVLTSWPVETSVVDAHMAADASGVGADITYTTGGSTGQPARLHVIADASSGTEYVVDLTGTMIEPTIIGWSDRSDGYADALLAERWEGIGSAVLVRVDRASPQRSTTTVLGQGACWTDTGLIARGTWTLSSESVYDEPGTVELVDPSDLSVVRDFGLDAYGGELACLSGERVVLTAYNGVASGPGGADAASIVPGSERTLILGVGDPTELVREPELRVSGRNAND